MVGGEFTAHVLATAFRFAMQILIARATRDRCHGHHLEVVSISAQGMKGLFEGHFDLETVTVASDQLQGAER